MSDEDARDNLLSEMGIPADEAFRMLHDFDYDAKTIAFCWDNLPILRQLLKISLLRRTQLPLFGPVHLVTGTRASGEAGIGHLKAENYATNADAYEAAKAMIGTEFSRYMTIADPNGNMIWNDQQVQDAIAKGAAYPSA